ncbi:MAG: hypothetical protein GC192_22795 [Bacteroidetes bacterium]|nr:hypothetical protein [Bacteroidota bacterium]
MTLLDKEFENLTIDYERIRASSIDELGGSTLLEELDEEGYNFENYNAVYSNSLYINIYTIFENSLLGICENSFAKDIYGNTKRKDGESLIAYYFRVVEKASKTSNDELRDELKVVDKAYRKLRNKLVHNRYLCSVNDFEVLKDLNGVSFLNDGLYQNKYRIVISDQEFLVRFIRRIRELIKGIYVFYHNEMIELNFKRKKAAGETP